jgi:hypothetical protein
MFKTILLATSLTGTAAFAEQEIVPVSYTVSYEKQTPLGDLCLTTGSLVAREDGLVLIDGDFKAQYEVKDGKGTAVTHVRMRRAPEGYMLTVRFFSKATKLVGFQEFIYGHGSDFAGPKMTLRGPINEGGCPNYIRMVIDPRS